MVNSVLALMAASKTHHWVMLPKHYYMFILFLSTLNIANSSNWVQTTGKIDQNVVITNIPAPDHNHWSARYGHSVVVMKSGKRPDIGEIFLMGGDTNDGSSVQDIPGFMDKSRSKGYKNDVWKSAGPLWDMRGDPRLRNDFKRQRAYTGTPKVDQKIPRVYSNMDWVVKSTGMLPNPGVAYDDWIICLDNFKDTPKYAAARKRMNCCEENSEENAENCITGQRMWSPRRNFQAVSFTPTNNQSYPNHPEYRGVEAIFLMGGRARELHTYDEERSIGGIMRPRVRDVGEDEGLDKATQIFTSQREAAVYKSDVWRSVDGQNWDLITPGCKAPQASLVAQGNLAQGMKGKLSERCRNEQDCYGVEKCENNYCVCPMWTSREQFGLAVYEGFLYVVGGYASHLYGLRSNCGKYACGDTDASSYRAYMSDVWSSPDGENWKLITQQAEFPGRGGHQLLTFPFAEQQYLWVIGGRGGDSDGNSKQLTYYNDIWRALVSVSKDRTTTSVGAWELFRVYSDGQPPEDTPMWAPRAGHTAILELATPYNGQIRTLHVVGGQTEKGFSDEVWTLQVDNAHDKRWRCDWTDEQYFRVGSTTPGNLFQFSLPSPATDYVHAKSDLTFLKRFFLPLTGTRRIDRKQGAESEKRPYLTDARIELLNEYKIFTIEELANADIQTILRLRGYYPGQPRRSGDALPEIDPTHPKVFADVCDVKYLAKEIIKMCQVDSTIGYYDGERQMPWNIEPSWNGPAPHRLPAAWHGRNYADMNPVLDYDTLVKNWDGCSALSLPESPASLSTGTVLNFHQYPNVNGFGFVAPVPSIRDSHDTVQELQCRYYPRTRAYHASILFMDKVYVFGGKSKEKSYNADSWYRDDRFPTARILKKPTTYSPQYEFEFGCDEPGCIFEYRVWDPYSYKELRRWTPVTHRTSIHWLDWRMKGPGDGDYRLYVRAIDPAGNKDIRYVVNMNIYDWYYVSPTPWDIIAEAVFSFLGLCYFAYLEYRRRLKKAAMERYAMKRMRRKFKALQKEGEGGAVDWRSLYNESKLAQTKTDRKKKKEGRDKAKEKRDREKKKKDKEKEDIKKKLKAGKAFKEKKKEVQKEKTGESTKKKDKKKKKGKSGEDDFTDLAEQEENQDGGDGSKAPKLKDYEKSGGGKDEKKLKDYEKAGQAAATPAEEGTKQRKANPRFKDYEKSGGQDKKDV